MATRPQRGAVATRPSAALTRPLALPGLPRPDALALGGLAMVVLFLFRDALFGGQAFFLRDVHMVWHPQVETFVRCVVAGSWPVWDSYRGFGQPLLADPSAQIAYPPTWLNLVMRPWTYYTALVVGHALFSAAGAFALGRHWGLGAFGAFVAAALWVASGPFLSLADLWHHLCGAAWMPWVFLAADRALAARRMGPALLWGAAMGAQVLAGSADMCAMTLLGVAALALVRHVGWGARASAANVRLALTAGGAVLFALAASAVLGLPAFDLAMRSARFDLPEGGRTAWSLHPFGLLELLLPTRWSRLALPSPDAVVQLEAREPWLHSIYLGAPGLLLVAAGAASRTRLRALLVGLGAAALLVALGRHTPAYRLLVTALPPLAILRYPSKAMVTAAFAWSLLGGFGAGALAAMSRAARNRLALAALTTSAGLAALAVILWRQPAATGPAGGAALAELLRPMALALAAALLVGPWTRRQPGSTFAAMALTSLTLADLLFAHRALHPMAPRALYTFRPPVLEALGPAADERLYVYDYSVPNRRQARVDPLRQKGYRLEAAPEGWSYPAALALAVQMYLNPPTAGRWGLRGSYDLDLLGLFPPWRQELVERLREAEDTPAHLRLLQVGNVGRVIALHPEAWWSDLSPLAELPGLLEQPIRVFQVPGALPRTYVVGAARLSDDAAAIRALGDPAFDPRREVLLAPTGRSLPTEANPLAVVGSSRVVEGRPDRVRIEAELRAPGWVVLVDGYDRGWRAAVDGRPAEVWRANVAFRAVRVGAGRHLVEYVYRPASVVVGLAVSATAFAVGLGLLAVSRRHRGGARLSPGAE